MHPLINFVNGHTEKGKITKTENMPIIWWKLQKGLLNIQKFSKRTTSYNSSQIFPILRLTIQLLVILYDANNDNLWRNCLVNVDYLPIWEIWMPFTWHWTVSLISIFLTQKCLLKVQKCFKNDKEDKEKLSVSSNSVFAVTEFYPALAELTKTLAGFICPQNVRRNFGM